MCAWSGNQPLSAIDPDGSADPRTQKEGGSVLQNGHDSFGPSLNPDAFETLKVISN